VTAPGAPFAALLDDVLCAALVCAVATEFGDLVAFYIADLKEPAGFALATAVRAKIAGPYPAVLREQALACPFRVRFMIGAAPVEMLARIVEELVGADSAERRAAAQLIRAIHARGDVPVLIVDEGSAAVGALDISLCQRPFVAEA
jgi:hypothetical protein